MTTYGQGDVYLAIFYAWRMSICEATSAVFIPADFNHASPVERDGLVWTNSELSMPDVPQTLHWKAPLDSSLALEGLEEYDPPTAGDARYVNKLGIAFVYIGKIRGWVALTDFV